MSKSLIYDLMDKVSKLKKVFDSHRSIKPLDHPDKSITPSKIDYINEPSEGLTLAYDTATGKFKWIAGAGMTVHDKAYHQSPVLPDNDVHRTSIPIDHPDGSVARSKLEYADQYVSFAYLACIDKVVYMARNYWSFNVLFNVVFSDKSVFAALQHYCWGGVIGRQSAYNTYYTATFNRDASAADHRLHKLVGGTETVLATEAVDIDLKGRGLRISCTSSTIRSMRYELNVVVNPLSLPTPNYTITVTDTSIPQGYFGYNVLRETYPHGGTTPDSVYLLPPASPSPQPIAFFEVPVIGSGTLDDPFRPQLPEEIVWDWSLNPIARKKYDILKSKGFTDEEIIELFSEVLSCRTNRLALTNSALIVSDSSGKPREYVAIVRIFDQPDRQPHLHPISKCIEELRKMKGVKELKRDQAIKRAKQLDDKLHDIDLVSIRELKVEKKKAVKEYKDWRRSQFRVEMEDNIAEQYVEEDKGW